MEAHSGRAEEQLGYELRGQILSGISNSMVHLYREHFGKGPTGAKTYVLDDLVICVLRDGLTTVEKTLFEQGRGDAASVAAGDRVPRRHPRPAR